MIKKAFEPKRIIKATTLIAAGLLALFFIPVPSAQTPYARMPLNDTVNRLSAQVAKEGLYGVATGKQTEAHVEDSCLVAVICEKNTGQPRIERLTFEFDNIFAIGIRILAFVTAFIIIYLWQAVGWCRPLLAVAGGFVVLPSLIFLRDFFFGALLTQITASTITSWLDSPFRFFILIITLFTPLAICGYKSEKKEGK